MKIIGILFSGEMIALITKGSKAQKLAIIYSISFVAWVILVWICSMTRSVIAEVLWQEKHLDFHLSLDIWPAVFTWLIYLLLKGLVGLDSSSTQVLALGPAKDIVETRNIDLCATPLTFAQIFRILLFLVFVAATAITGSKTVAVNLAQYYLMNVAILCSVSTVPTWHISGLILSVDGKGIWTQGFMGRKFVAWREVKSGKLTVYGNGLSNRPSLRLTLRDKYGDDIVRVHATDPEPAELENLSEFFEQNFTVESEAFVDVQLKT